MLAIKIPPGHVPEKSYVLAVLLGERLGIPYTIQVEEFLTEYKFILPNQRQLTIESHAWPRDEAYLRPENIPATATEFADPFEPGGTLLHFFGRPAIAVQAEAVHCRTDLLGAAFFMLTRWEEYARPERDAHGRFPASASLAVRAGFLHRPVVDEYVEALWRMLVHLGWPPAQRRRTAYRFDWSCDVDHPRLWWRPAHRLRTLAGSLWPRGSWRETAGWLRGPIARRRDPYDVFDAWMELAERHGHRIHFNFLGARDRSSDCYYPLQHPFVVDLLRKIERRGHAVGFHPSYEAFEQPALFSRELESLQRLVGQPITGGRHHYLRFAAPHTWRRWADAGLAWDSTLGYAEAPGFRCGTSHDFPVFDFLERRALSLREKPLVAMDVTPAVYQKITPEAARDEWRALKRRVQRHGGAFSVLWHNSSWETPFWRRWQPLLLEMLEE